LLFQDLHREFQRCRDNHDLRLDLSSNDITSIPSSIRDLTQLTELFLYKNKLTQLPHELGNLVSLRKLGLSENALCSLPDSLASLTQLETLDLRHNKLTEVCYCFFHHFRW
ncbi:leucine Rich repeat-containing domain protein, partial [Ancylostoma caninum]